MPADKTTDCVMGVEALSRSPLTAADPLCVPKQKPPAVRSFMILYYSCLAL